MGRRLYTVLFYLALPLIVLRLLYRAWRAPAYAERWRERFGGFEPGYRYRRLRAPLWVHAVSVGETIAAAPLIKALQQRYPQRDLVVTTMTPTGSERVKALFGDSVFHVYAPYDMPLAVERFLRRIEPSLLIIMETELWPNMIACAQARRIPVVLVNARLSARSARGYARVRWLATPMLNQLTLIAAQFNADAERFGRLGLDRSRVQVTGNIKFDVQISPEAVALGALLREGTGNRPAWIAASTHAGEDEIILQAHRQILAQVPKALLILVPRHPERFDGVSRLARDAGFAVSTRRQDGCPVASTQVFVGDTMGELPGFYAAADVAFVGGSLVERGGHNPLEPAALSLPVIMGPHVFNFQSICEALATAGGLLFAGSAELVAQRVTELLQDPAHRQETGARALSVVDGNRGALERTLDALAPLIS